MMLEVLCVCFISVIVGIQIQNVGAVKPIDVHSAALQLFLMCVCVWMQYTCVSYQRHDYIPIEIHLAHMVDVYY